MIARLALVIAQFQCDEMYRSHADAVSELLPLDSENWITCGNSLRLNWMKVCPPDGLDSVVDDDGELALKKSTQSAVKFDAEGCEVYICGNPPFVSAHGYSGRSADQSKDMDCVFSGSGVKYGDLDYVTAWFMLAARYMSSVGNALCVSSAFVSTNSICQGKHVPLFWPTVFELGSRINFAYTSFKWKNHASDNAAVAVVIIGLTNVDGFAKIFSVGVEGETFKDVDNINPYLIPGKNMVVNGSSNPICEQSYMRFGNAPRDNGGGLMFSLDELKAMSLSNNHKESFIRRCLGTAEFIRGVDRYCLWIGDDQVSEATKLTSIRKRIDNVRVARLAARSDSTKAFAGHPHRFGSGPGIAKETTMIVPIVSSERREYLPIGLFSTDVVVMKTAFTLFDAPLWNLSLLSSRLHLIWVSTVGGRLEDRFSYSNSICWNAFPIPKLTSKNKSDMEKCARNILKTREDHTPATIAELYDPDKMPKSLRAAHARNDEVIARIYIGRDEFRDDTEMREKLFHMYAEMMENPATAEKQKKATRSNKPLKDGLFARKQSSAPAPDVSPKEARRKAPDRNPAAPKPSGKPTNRKPGKSA